MSGGKSFQHYAGQTVPAHSGADGKAVDCPHIEDKAADKSAEYGADSNAYRYQEYAQVVVSYFLDNRFIHADAYADGEHQKIQQIVGDCAEQAVILCREDKLSADYP